MTIDMTHKTLPEGLHPDTLAVRAAIEKSQYGENSEALYLTSSFVQPNAETAARRFAMEEEATPIPGWATRPSAAWSCVWQHWKAPKPP